MTIKHAQEYRDPELARRIAANIRRISRRPVRLMEVCGTHTMSIFRNGIRSLLPKRIGLLSGPGCPVCVTAQVDIDGFILLARMPDVIVTTFGDLMRVPGTTSSLERERAAGRDVRMVYSSVDALDIARQNPRKRVVFLGIGFETTAPTVAAAIASAAAAGVDNFFVYSAHKLVPPALAALMAADVIDVDGFLLPGHVSVIIGTDAYRPLVDRYRIPAVIGGFEPADILQAVFMLIDQIENTAVRLENAYPRAVTAAGNRRALQLMGDVFDPGDSPWRGLGTIPASGLMIRDAYAAFDARKIFDIEVAESEEPRGCACGDIITGVKTPPQCPLYKTVCTPLNPVGPCMVSSEGTCAAYYRYYGESST